MEELSEEEKLAVERLKEILNGIMQDYQCGREDALRIAEQWIAEAVEKRQQNKRKV
ncbi:hypothetical protein GCM10027361_00560 [Erwinia aphidicola]